MEELYKISPEDAAKIYKEWIDEHGIHRIIKAENEQVDGTLLLSKTEYEKIKDEALVKTIDWTKKAVITDEQVDSKDKEILIDEDPK